jgi:antibiotic biosynthesis monooxygenase (ABM) superfamily enzyme
MTATKPPKKWKMAILVWTAIYPTITILLACLDDYFAKITPLPLRTAAITVIAVPLMVYSILPLLQKAAARWLHN